jgi:hypothetical protein
MEETGPQQEECSCLNEGTCDQDTVEVKSLGANSDFADATILKCRRCGRYWLHYFIEYEYLTAAGRWFRGVITPETAASADAASAKKILEGLQWYFRGAKAMAVPASWAARVKQPFQELAQRFLHIPPETDCWQDSTLQK